MSKRATIFALAIGTFIALPSLADAGQTTQTAGVQAAGVTIEQGSARPIAGWVDFCQRYPQECTVDTAEPAIITLDRDNWALINEVNRTVNAEIQPMTDMENYGVPDYWTFPYAGYGDCEDYQLLKRKRLADAGVPRRAMRMTVVIDEQGEGHAVLMIRTDRGDFILDNVTDDIVSWHETPYVYVSRESQHATAWTSLGHTAAPTITATR
ncbi:MAG: transglutaminase-like cysteine peptidase [Salinarimonas sp.]|nr:transglutaminase-like cysteine peptidase [Salinarimonas sp.]